MKNLFVTGIGTEVGKTISAAVLCNHFRADYWKPIQSGDLQQSDALKIKKLTHPYFTHIHPERYRLQCPASPHQSAAMEEIAIRLTDFEIPATSNRLIIEGAGGLFVPLSNKAYMIDLIEQFDCPVALVVKDYLGCINHFTLSYHALLQRGLNIKYIVFNGDFNPYTKDAILWAVDLSKTEILAIPRFSTLDYNQITQSIFFL